MDGNVVSVIAVFIMFAHSLDSNLKLINTIAICDERCIAYQKKIINRFFSSVGTHLSQTMFARSRPDDLHRLTERIQRFSSKCSILLRCFQVINQL